MAVADRDIEQVADQDARCADCGATSIIIDLGGLDPAGRCAVCREFYEDNRGRFYEEPRR